MNTLVTGAGGQLGTALTDILGARAIPLRHSDLDIADRAAVRDAVKRQNPGLIVNAAAYNFVDKAETDPAPAFAANETGPRNLAEAAAAAGIPFVHVSTDYVFDGRLGRAYVESDETNPLSQYAKSKLAGERAVMKAHPGAIVVRTAWVYHDTGRSFFRLMWGLSAKGPVRVVADQVSSPTYAPHLAEAILTLASTGASGVFHLAGSGGGVSRYDQLKEFYRLIGFDGKVSPVSMAEFPQPAPRPKFTPLETERSPRVKLPDWRDGVAIFAKAFLAAGKV